MSDSLVPSSASSASSDQSNEGDGRVLSLNKEKGKSEESTDIRDSNNRMDDVSPSSFNRRSNDLLMMLRQRDFHSNDPKTEKAEKRREGVDRLSDAGRTSSNTPSQSIPPTVSKPVSRPFPPTLMLPKSSDESDRESVSTSDEEWSDNGGEESASESVSSISSRRLFSRSDLSDIEIHPSSSGLALNAAAGEGAASDHITKRPSLPRISSLGAYLASPLPTARSKEKSGRSPAAVPSVEGTSAVSSPAIGGVAPLFGTYRRSMSLSAVNALEESARTAASMHCSPTDLACHAAYFVPHSGLQQTPTTPPRLLQSYPPPPSPSASASASSISSHHSHVHYANEDERKGNNATQGNSAAGGGGGGGDAGASMTANRSESTASTAEHLTSRSRSQSSIHQEKESQKHRTEPSDANPEKERSPSTARNKSIDASAGHRSRSGSLGAVGLIRGPPIPPSPSSPSVNSWQSLHHYQQTPRSSRAHAENRRGLLDISGLPSYLEPVYYPIPDEIPSLFYFPIAGKCELIKILLEFARAPYRFVCVPFGEQVTLADQGRMPFGQLPIYEEKINNGVQTVTRSPSLHPDDIFRLSHVGPIVRYLAKKLKLMPTDERMSAKCDLLVEGCTELLSKYYSLAVYKTMRQEEYERTMREWLAYFTAFFNQNEHKLSNEAINTPSSENSSPPSEKIISDYSTLPANIFGEVTYADPVLWECIDLTSGPVGGSMAGSILSEFGILHAFHKKMQKHEAIDAYIHSKRRIR